MTSEMRQRMANAIRFLSADAVEAAQSGHPGLPMGAADIATVLFTRFLTFDPKTPDWPDRDRFVFSAGHGSMLLYSLLYLLGYGDIDIDEIKRFRQLGAKTAGHPEYGHAAGIETTTGPLGQGTGNAVGMALAERILNAHFGDDVVNHFTYALVGDGCLMEGICQEAIALAGHLKLNKLIFLWDDNGITIDGKVSLADSTDQLARFEACGWQALACDGHDHDAIASAILTAKASDRPTLIAAKTTIGFGAPNKAGTNKAHGSPLGADEVAATREALGWPHAPFEVPSDILDQWRIAGLRSSVRRKEWETRFAAVDAETRGEFERRMRGDLPSGFIEAMHRFKRQMNEKQPKVATRKASEMALEEINAVVPETIGGSADLTGSNNTRTSQTRPIAPGDYSGRFIHYGIREHGMAAIMNGMALHGGMIPYSGTFLTFADYCRGALRLSALMGIRVIHVMTHDSIGLGEDGPTHQPVEHLASLRAIPNMLVFRPADAVETAECWQLALQSRAAPSILALSRQSLPTLRLDEHDENKSARGAYEISPASGEAQVTIYATGSEVEIAVAARAKLEATGTPTRVVSVPSFELFRRQTSEYRRALTDDDSLKVAIEAGIRQGWDELIGRDGIFIGMTGFGASGPAPELYAHFGITADALVAAVNARLAETQVADED
ncbi:transketolase [Jiella sp. MQZ9-1]|uniref:Transketolase n=1 Tax=Jiella flava TaxID=2816857 RepID=A0A939JVK6_9HYPH|nr:transketolase [Jiella flava]MBO0662062.1 transketolase [Jiella flava]MCD2470610.1 transketolase [Jiella flava]